MEAICSLENIWSPDITFWIAKWRCRLRMCIFMCMLTATSCFSIPKYLENWKFQNVWHCAKYYSNCLLLSQNTDDAITFSVGSTSPSEDQSHKQYYKSTISSYTASIRVWNFSLYFKIFLPVMAVSTQGNTLSLW
jgi:hypothetical protein